jgi:hypothetical protein
MNDDLITGQAGEPKVRARHPRRAWPHIITEFNQTRQSARDGRKRACRRSRRIWRSAPGAKHQAYQPHLRGSRCDASEKFQAGTRANPSLSDIISSAWKWHKSASRDYEKAQDAPHPVRVIPHFNNFNLGDCR